MFALVQTGKYGDMNTIDKTTMGYYVIKFILLAYTLQEERMCFIRISTNGELFVKAQYMKFM